MRQGKVLLAPVLAVVAALVLAGCAAPAEPVAPAADAGAREPLTADAFGLGEFLSQKVEAFDGVALHLDVQLPDGEGPFPTILVYTPYSSTLNPAYEAWGLTRSLGQRPTELAIAKYYVPKGYAVAVGHVRGSGQSGGCFTVGGPEEARDGYSLVEHIANQTWSTGKVAMMGTSYVGTTPISTATLAPPHLTTIVPVAAVTEWYRYYMENGEPRFFGELPFGVVYTDHPLWMATGLVPKPRHPAGTDAAGQAACARALGENAYLQDDYNDFWRARDYVKDLGNATAPMLYAHGFLDENTATSLVTDFFNAYPAPKQMWLQQHGHGVPASYEAYHQHVHRWLDHWLMGRDNGAMDWPAVVIEDNRGQYRTEPDWPPKNATLALLHLAPGKLQTGAPEAGEATYRDAPVAMEELRALAAVPGTFLRFETDPLEAPLHVAGAPRLTLVAKSSARDTQFAALLYDVAPDGTETFLTRGYLDARHRQDLSRGTDLEPGKEYTFSWALHGRDHHVGAGHRLALVVASTDKYVVPDDPGAVNTVLFGADASVLALPVLDLSRATFSDAPPATR